MSVAPIYNFIVSFFIAIIATASAASASACSDLIQELRAMQRAQAEIKKSLVANHDLFASTIEEYADEAAGVSMRGPKNPVDVAKNMRLSAKSFRIRGFRSQLLVNKLDKASEVLLGKVAVCLSVKK